MKRNKRTKRTKVWGAVAAILVLLLLIALLGNLLFRKKAPDPERPKIGWTDDGGDIIFVGKDRPPTPPSPPSSGPLTLNMTQIVFAPGAKEEATLIVSGKNAEAAAWRVEWQDPASEWATGKEATDYVGLNSTLRGASLSLKAPFAERIVIACTDRESTATCICDCAQVIETFRMTFNKQYPEYYQLSYGPNVKMTLSGNYIQTRDGMQDVVYSPYTLAQTSELTESTMSLTQEFIDSFQDFCAGEENVPDTIMEKLSSLDTETQTPIIFESNEPNAAGSYMVYGGTLPALAFQFPLLTAGLEKQMTGTLSYLLRDWLLQTEGQIPIICNHIGFHGSVCDYVIEYESLFDISRLTRGNT